MSGKAFAHSSPENRNDGDLYETPLSMTRALLDREKFRKNGHFLEPACGGGAIVRVLAERFENINFYDKDVDFLTEDRKFDYIITNPPYSLADEFVEKAKSLKPRKFAMLLRTNYLSGQKRIRAGVFSGLSHVYIFSRMPDLRAPIREDGKFPTAAIVYGWFVWDRYKIGNPVISWIDNGNFVLRKGDI